MGHLPNAYVAFTPGAIGSRARSLRTNAGKAWIWIGSAVVLLARAQPLSSYFNATVTQSAPQCAAQPDAISEPGSSWRRPTPRGVLRGWHSDRVCPEPGSQCVVQITTTAKMTSVMRRILKTLVVSLCCISLLGCSSLRPVLVSDDQHSEHAGLRASGLQVGDNVIVVRKDGTEVSFVVTNLSPEILEGKQTDSQLLVSVPVAEVQSVKRREWDALKTLALVVGSVLAVYLVVYVVRGVAAAKVLNTPYPGG
jgi:hypothetical protein